MSGLAFPPLGESHMGRTPSRLLKASVYPLQWGLPLTHSWSAEVNPIISSPFIPRTHYISTDRDSPKYSYRIPTQIFGPTVYNIPSPLMVVGADRKFPNMGGEGPIVKGRDLGVNRDSHMRTGQGFGKKPLLAILSFIRRWGMTQSPSDQL